MKTHRIDTFQPDFSPAYLANGVVGLRIKEFPFLRGQVLVNGFVGYSGEKGIEEYAEVPWILGLDFQLGSTFLSKRPDLAKFIKQEYDHSCGELHCLFEIPVTDGAIKVKTITLCSRSQPSLVLQECVISASTSCELNIHALIDPRGLEGTLLKIIRPQTKADGILHWESRGGISQLGIAYATECLGYEDIEGLRNNYGHEEDCMQTIYPLKLEPIKEYRIRQIVSLVPSCMHEEPHMQASRLLGMGLWYGFDELRNDNRECWEKLWKSRIKIDADNSTWQEIADAAFFYLHSSIHPSSPHSVAPFGLSQRSLYSGHVFWDTETFMLAAVLFTQPEAARAMLEYRSKCIPRARDNAKLHGYKGIHFPWQSGTTGAETVPFYCHGGYLEHHINYDIAFAFAQYGYASGDREFIKKHVWPVLKGIAEWTESRVKKTMRGYEIQHVTGIDESINNINNNSYTNMGAIVILREAISCAQKLGFSPPTSWQEIAGNIYLPIEPKTNVMLKHDAYEYQGGMCLPETLAGFFPFNYEPGSDVKKATMDYHFNLADTFLGMPMLSSLFGVWACQQNKRQLANEFFKKGIASYLLAPFMQFCEQSPDRPVSFLGRSTGDCVFLTNPAGFLMALITGLTGMKLSDAPPEEWFNQPVTLPQGWKTLQIDSFYAQGCEYQLLAQHGKTTQLQKIGLQNELTTKYPFNYD